MQDPCFIPGVIRKPRPVCGNPACGKLLSALNKQGLCFCCHDKVRLPGSMGLAHNTPRRIITH